MKVWKTETNPSLQVLVEKRKREHSMDAAFVGPDGEINTAKSCNSNKNLAVGI